LAKEAPFTFSNVSKKMDILFEFENAMRAANVPRYMHGLTTNMLMHVKKKQKRSKCFIVELFLYKEHDNPRIFCGDVFFRVIKGAPTEAKMSTSNVVHQLKMPNDVVIFTNAVIRNCFGLAAYIVNPVQNQITEIDDSATKLQVRVEQCSNRLECLDKLINKHIEICHK
jgi:hypothetical protein